MIKFDYEFEYEDPIDEYEAMKRVDPILKSVDELIARGNHDVVETLKIALMMTLKIKHKLMDEVYQLDQIRPRLFKMPDGKTSRWDAPDDLVQHVIGFENK